MKSLRLLSLAVVLALAGCNVLPQPQAESVRYFTLTSPVATAAAADGTRVQPVLLAGHLHGRAMAVRVGADEVAYLDDVRWAEPLAEGLTHLLRARLAAIPGGAVVAVQVQRCELNRAAGGQVELAATYTITSADKSGSRTATFTSSPRSWKGGDYATLVALLREAIGELGDTIAAALPVAKP